MPHYLVKGARKSDATDKTIVVHAQSERAAIESANGHGLFVASVEALDAGERDRISGGDAWDIRPLAGMLRDSGRVQDGIEVLLWTFELDAAEGCPSPIHEYLLVSEYLESVERFDEAIQYLHELKSGRIVGLPSEEICAFEYGEVYERLAELYATAGDDRLASCYKVASGLAFIAHVYRVVSKSALPTGQPERNGAFNAPHEVLEVAVAFLSEVCSDAVTCVRVARSLFKGEGWIDFETATDIAVRAEAEVARLLRCSIPSGD